MYKKTSELFILHELKKKQQQLGIQKLLNIL